MEAIERDAAGIGALADPVRRRLYRYVCAQPAPVSRDQAAAAAGIPRHQAKFHLDRLEAEGLLETEYARLGGRSGPGAGRTSKLYRRAARDIAVSLPDREYELAGRLMADAIAASVASGEPVLAALHRLAAEHGRTLGAGAVTTAGRPESAGAALALAVRILAGSGYEPRAAGEEVVLANCPFHALARAQTELVCRMNHALVGGVAATLDPHCPRVALAPDPDRCCVVLAPAGPGAAGPRVVGAGPAAPGVVGAGPAGPGPAGPGPAGPGPAGPGPAGPGPAGPGVVGAGPAGFGPAGDGPPGGGA